MSTAHVGRVFKDYTNLSVPEYMQEVRMNKTLELLQESKYSIGEISVKVGIENITYFYKVFKKRFGITPKEYAQKNL
jgi:YesN/AraC family two-component response regulator